MIKIPSTTVIFVGQSNMADPLRQKLNEIIAKGTYGRIRCFGNKFGGQSMEARVSGTPGSYTRSANYLNELNMWNAGKCDHLVVVWFQGESDAADNTDTARFTGRLDAWYQFIREDLVNPNGTIETVYCLPWRTDTINGFGIGGNGDTIRQTLTARAASEAPLSVTFETSSYARYDNVHLTSGAVLTGLGPALGNVVLNFIN